MQGHEQAPTEQQSTDFHGQLATCVDEVRPRVDTAYLGGSNAPENTSAASPSFNPTAISRLEPHATTRFTGQLRLHRALDEIGWSGGIDEFNAVARTKYQSVPEPILITTSGTILAGFGRWQASVFEGRRELHCIEYSLSEDESLQFMLTYHQSRRGWNAFVRIRLALTQEPFFQQKALNNMRDGGKYKGLAILPAVQRIDVRQEIASAAGVGARNVSNVKTILEVAHPRLIEALRNGELKINRAIQFCKLPRAEQLEQFVRWSEERATTKVIHRSITSPKEANSKFDTTTALDLLQQREARQPGSIVVKASQLPQTVVFIGRDLLTAIYSQKELELT